MREKAFTLVELLVVMVIIGILLGLAVPTYQRVLQGGRASACISNLRQIGVALNLYLADNNGRMPMLQAARSSTTQDVAVIDNTLNRYAPAAGVFACPADTAGLAASTGTSYFWNSGLDGQPLPSLHFVLSTLPSLIPVLCDKEGFHPYIENKVNMLYADGHASKDLIFSTGP